MRFPKEDFEINLESKICICPARSPSNFGVPGTLSEDGPLHVVRTNGGLRAPHGHGVRGFEKRVSRAERSAPLGGWNPTALLPPIRPDAGKSAQPKAADVDARLAVEHEVADDLARGG